MYTLKFGPAPLCMLISFSRILCSTGVKVSALCLRFIPRPGCLYEFILEVVELKTEIKGGEVYSEFSDNTIHKVSATRSESNGKTEQVNDVANGCR